LSAKWKVEFPNTGFWTFIKYTIVEQHAWEMPRDMAWKDQSTIVHGFMQMVGFNRYSEESGNSFDYIDLLEKIGDGWSMSGALATSRTLDREPVIDPKPTNVSIYDILEYGEPTKEFPFGLEASMKQEYMPFALAELRIPRCEDASDKLKEQVCGILIQHEGSCSCWINMPTFRGGGPIESFISELLFPLLKIPSRVTTFYEMWMRSQPLRPFT
jgi:hypothetical protein